MTEATPSSPILERSDAPAETLKKKTMIRQKKHLVSFRIEKSYSTRNDPKTLKFQWIGFRASLNGKLQKPWFLPPNTGVSTLDFPLNGSSKVNAQKSAKATSESNVTSTHGLIVM